MNNNTSSLFPRQTELLNPNDSPLNKDLHFLNHSFNNFFSENYWKKICPDLHINDSNFQKESLKINKLPLDDINNYKKQINDEGYFKCLNKNNSLNISMEQLAINVVKLMQYGWPPSFLIMFDEIWSIVHYMSDIMYQTTGNKMNMDILIWYIDPNKDQSGFSPHRDRQPDNPKSTFRNDGTPLYSTCWMPFTDACPDNSCLYMIPSWADPGYYNGDLDDKDPLQVALPSKEAYQNIRCIPLYAGSSVIFTHRIIHWGSKGKKGYPTPRIAVSFAGADDSYEPAYFSRDNLPFPPIELRLSLLSAQMLIYYQRFSFSSKELSLFYKMYKSNSQQFCTSYSQKVEYEFVNSVKESKDLYEVDDSKSNEEDNDEDSDIMDDALNAILEAKMGGFDGFNDDFDELSDIEMLSANAYSEDDEEEDEGFF